MKLVKLNGDVTVSPTCITWIEVDHHGRGVTVWADGRGVFVYNDYGQTSYRTKDRIVNDVNAALEEGGAA